MEPSLHVKTALGEAILGLSRLLISKYHVALGVSDIDTFKEVCDCKGKKVVQVDDFRFRVAV